MPGKWRWVLKFSELKVPGACVIEPEKIEDHRGFFARSWCRDEYRNHGLDPTVAQANVAANRIKGTLRGLHFQLPPFAEVKVIRCTKGAIYDVIVDLRPDSATFKQWVGVELTDDNWKMLYVPEGCATGYVTLTDGAAIFYQTTKSFARDYARGVRYNDPAFGIEWPLPVCCISAADQNWPDFGIDHRENEA